MIIRFYLEVVRDVSDRKKNSVEYLIMSYFSYWFYDMVYALSFLQTDA